MAEPNAALSLLKADLGYFDSELNPAVEAYLRSLLEYARSALAEQCHIYLVEDDVYDGQLQAMYAAWIYRYRSSGAGKPEMLKAAIRDRQVSKALYTARLSKGETT